MGATKVTREVPLPKCVWVGTYEFPMGFVDAADPRLDEANGMCETGEGETRIWIAARMGLRKTLEIVIHEITHAINWVYDIDDGVDEEDIATKHGAAWSQFFLDNPKYQRWLAYTVNRIRKERKDA